MQIKLQNEYFDLDLGNAAQGLESVATIRLPNSEDDEDFLSSLAYVLVERLAVVPDCIDLQPTISTLTASAIVVNIEARSGGDEPIFDGFRSEIEPEALAMFLLKAVRWGDVETATPNKRLALEVAEAFGPDWAQVLYHFAVLVTKLA
jgi:hypothetical protein